VVTTYELDSMQRVARATVKNASVDVSSTVGTPSTYKDVATLF
jgi:hypothetical protein